jgi:tartrate dehydrogenase/decarboxylase/D-malate dehydrogenase
VTYRLAVIPGDGIGPEVVDAGLALLDAVAARGGPRFDVVRYPWGAGHYLATGRVMAEDGLERLREADAILLGAIGDPRVPDPISVRGLVIRIRQAFDLYVNLRPVRLLPGVATPLRDVSPSEIDMVMIRENSEGEYAGIGGRVHAGTEDEAAVEAAYFSRRGIRRVARFAFQQAMRRRRHLVSVTKSNALVHGMVFWDEVVQEVAGEFPEVRVEPMLADAAALHLVRNPARFDVVLASNLFGDILTDLGAAISGGMGLAASANLDPERRAPSMFEPIHGSAPDIAGKGVANPLATFWSCALLLDHLGEEAWARRIHAALERVFVETDVRTPDQGGRNTTAELTEAFVALL